jgi:hypothetical protein
VTNRIHWTPKPTERVLIEHLPVEFVRTCDGTSLVTVLAALKQGLSQLTTPQINDLFKQFVVRRNAKRVGAAIVARALKAEEFSVEELSEIRRGL